MSFANETVEPAIGREVAAGVEREAGDVRVARCGAGAGVRDIDEPAETAMLTGSTPPDETGLPSAC